MTSRRPDALNGVSTESWALHLAVCLDQVGSAVIVT
jgi:hypothetical protein